jgi:hypothetical protein
LLDVVDEIELLDAIDQPEFVAFCAQSTLVAVIAFVAKVAVIELLLAIDHPEFVEFCDQSTFVAVIALVARVAVIAFVAIKDVWEFVAVPAFKAFVTIEWKCPGSTPLVTLPPTTVVAVAVPFTSSAVAGTFPTPTSPWWMTSVLGYNTESSIWFTRQFTTPAEGFVEAIVRV